MNFKTIEDVKAYIANLDLSGKTGREAMRHIGKETVEAICAIRGGNSLLSEKIGNANPGILSRDRGDLGWREVGHRENGDNSATSTSTSTATVKRVKGFLPPQTMAWANRQLAAAHCAAGGDPDDVPEVDITPSVFSGIPAFKAQRQGWLDHVAKMGGLDSEPMRALRAWLGKPLTAEQAEIEAAAANTGKKKMRMKELAYNVNRVNSLLHELNIDSSAIESLVDLVARIGFVDDCGNLIV